MTIQKVTNAKTNQRKSPPVPFSQSWHTLGVLRMIPGGKDMPIMRTGWNRVTGLVKNKKRFRKYELEPDKARGIGPEIYLADRKKLALEVKNTYENNLYHSEEFTKKIFVIRFISFVL